MKNLNYKPEIFEMIATDPMLQAKIANRVDVTEIEYIKDLAEENEPILTIGQIPTIVINHFNKSMPENRKEKVEYLFDGLQPIYTAKFQKEILELTIE